MFADLCYFSVRSVQVSHLFLLVTITVFGGLPFNYYIIFAWRYLYINCSSCLQLTFVFLVLPCLLLGYLGQAAYLMEHQSETSQAFFYSIPSKLLLSLSTSQVAAS